MCEGTRVSGGMILPAGSSAVEDDQARLHLPRNAVPGPGPHLVSCTPS